MQAPPSGGIGTGLVGNYLIKSVVSPNGITVTCPGSAEINSLGDTEGCPANDVVALNSDGSTTFTPILTSTVNNGSYVVSGSTIILTYPDNGSTHTANFNYTLSGTNLQLALTSTTEAALSPYIGEKINLTTVAPVSAG